MKKSLKNKIAACIICVFAIIVYSGCMEAYDFDGAWQGELSNIAEVTESQGNPYGVISFSFSGINPEADTYTVFYEEGVLSLSELINHGRSILITPGVVTIEGLEDGKEYSYVVEAVKGGFKSYSPVRQARTRRQLGIDVVIREFDLNTVVEWKFTDKNGETLLSDSDIYNITLNYTNRGLAIIGGKLTTNIISENVSLPLNSISGEYTIVYDGPDLVMVNDIIVSAIVDGMQVESRPRNGPSGVIERRLYNIAYNKAQEYGALEMFSHGRSYSSAGSLGPTVQARASTIVNYRNGNPTELYGATFSLGHGGLSGAAAATQNREWYYDGSTLYGRSNGGNTNVSSGGTNATSPTKPAASWATINSVASGHTAIWTPFAEAFRQNPWGYMPNNVNNAYKGLYNYKYTNPQSTSNNWTSGRSDAPEGIIDTSTRGALACNSDGTFEFTIELNADASGNGTNIIWSGDQTIKSLGNSYITFVIDEDMKFVKYHAMDSYTVQLLSATTYTCATMYFVYHRNPVALNSHATYRPHQLRPAHVNYCDCTNCDSVIAPNGNVVTGDMVVANSKYDITLDWTNDCTTTVSIP